MNNNSITPFRVTDRVDDSRMNQFVVELIQSCDATIQEAAEEKGEELKALFRQKAQELEALKRQINSLIEKVNRDFGNNLKGIVIIPLGEDIPVSKRKEGILYLKTTNRETVPGLNTELRVSSNMGLRIIEEA